MSGLYTRFMEWIMPFLETNWQLFLITAGLLFLLGAIFRWKWVCDPQGEDGLGFRAFVYRNFGEKGYRILQGIGGAVIILCSAVLWVLM